MRAIFKRKLTPLDATKLRPKAKTFLIWDTQERGLALQVRPTGHKSYKFIYHHRDHDKSCWITIGPADTISLADARQEATRLRLEVHQGKDPAGTRRASRGGNSTAATFAVIASRYVEEHAKKKNRSWKQAEALIRRNVLPVLGDHDASTISRSDVRAMLAKIDAPILQNQTLASCSAIFTWAGKQELLTNNPCKGVERNDTTKRDRVLSDAEVLLFWNAFGNAGIAGLALQVLLLTGQRPGEVARLRREHIKDNWWEMPGQPEAATEWPGTKNKQPHRVWLPSPVRNLIAELNDDDGTGFVFGTVPNLDAPMRDICKALNVPRATPHDLRRTHGSTITRLGFGKDAMNRIENHKEGGISSVYDRYGYADENQKIMESVAAKIIALAEGAKISSNVVTLRS